MFVNCFGVLVLGASFKTMFVTCVYSFYVPDLVDSGCLVTCSKSYMV